jgi:(S)-2-hydroxyglutarate dehydrogenase
MLIDFCKREKIPFELCGKLIVATSKEQLSKLDELYSRAIKNGLNKVIKVESRKIPDYEPNVAGVAGLYVPYTGIVDYKEVSAKYAEIITKMFGGEIYYNQELKKIIKKESGVEAVTQDKTHEGDFIINTAGLYSDKIALMTEKNLDVRIIPFRGEYCELKPNSASLVKNLIYPVPDPKFPFLGVHLTRMINGGVEAGPNAVWAFAREGYKFTNFKFNDFFGDLFWPGFLKVIKLYWKTGIGEYWHSFNRNALTRALQELVPEIKKEDLITGGAGVRAQACDRNGGLIDDFLIRENKWAINVLNAPSPAATASLAIGESITALALKRMK